MFRKLVVFISIISLFSPGLHSAQTKTTGTPVIKGPYLGQIPPELKAELFAPGLASTGLHDDMGPAFSPDGTEVFFRTAGKPYGIITTMKQDNGVWSEPDLAFWSGQYADGFVHFSHDGRKLYFGSKRPASGEWGIPIHMGENVNSAESDTWPRISPDGKYLFFASWRYSDESFSEKPVTYDEIMTRKRGPGYGWGADIYWVSTKAVTDLKPE